MEISDMNNENIDVQISVAKKYPRKMAEIIENIKSIVTLNSDIAESCYYKLPIAGEVIEGPSVRLAELILFEWGNIHIFTKLIGIVDGNAMAVGAAWDLEKNIKTVQGVTKPIVNRDGKKFSQFRQQMVLSAVQSIAFRNSIFKIIPRVFVDSVCKLAKESVQNKVDNIKNKSIASDKVKFVVDRILKLGMPVQELLRVLNCDSLDSINTSMYSDLIGIGTSIKENGQYEEKGKFISKEKSKNLQKVAQSLGANEENICSALGVSSFDYMNEEHAKECDLMLEGIKNNGN